VVSIDKVYAKNDFTRETFDDAKQATYKLMESACIGKVFMEFCLKHQEEEEKKPRNSLMRLRKTKSDSQRSTESLNLEAYFLYKESPTVPVNK
jgi:hypothetical protein